MSLRAAPARRGLRQCGSNPAGMAIGWLAALLLHGGVLLAVILDRPRQVPQTPGRTAVSLVLQPPGQKSSSPPVAPKPVQLPPARPPAPAMIANAPAARQRLAAKPAIPARVTPPAQSAPLAPNGAVRQSPAPAAPSFVAAIPLPGNVNQPPAYPDAAVAHGEQGRVLLSIHVLPDGRTDFVSVTQGSGYRILDQAAQDAVLHWRFQPATASGRPVVMVIPFWINFDLQTQSVQNGQ